MARTSAATGARFAPHAHRSRRLTILILFAMSMVAALLFTVPSGASTPSSGTIGPGNPQATWTGPVQTAITQGPDNCSDPGAFCDSFMLTVDVPPAYWDTHNGGADVKITWDTPNNDFDLYIYQSNQQVTHSAGSASTSEEVFVPKASGVYEVRVVYFMVVNSGYSGTAVFQSKKSGGGAVIFDNTPVAFGPSAVVSASWVAGEPQTTIERKASYSDPGAVNSKRVFVDWPLSSRTEIGQLSRSTDGGNSFRLLYDLTCAQRSRPTCQTGGGGDTEEDVNLKNGNVFFADQEVLANESVASSIDHGDTWPSARQFAVSNGATGVDRQWLAATDSTASVGPEVIDSFFSYHIPAAGQFIQGLDQNGLPIAQPVTQIPNVGQSGQLRVDNTDGPAHGWIYQPYRDLSGHYMMGTADSNGTGPNSWQSPTGWQENLVSNDVPQVFPWLALDSHGNAYAVWITGGLMSYSFSPIDDKANNPSSGGRPGTFWAPQAQVSLPSVTSTVFPEVIAGDPGRVGITYTGTTECQGVSDNCSDDTHWNEYAAVIRNALQEGGPAVVSTGLVNHRIMHRGNICTSGTACLTTGKDRSLLDMNDIGVFQDGTLGVVYGDNFSTFGDVSESTGGGEDNSPFVHFARLVTGPKLFVGQDLGATPQIPVEPAVSKDPAGDATWPNTSGGTNLPSLDLRLVDIDRLNGKVVGRLKVADGSVAQRQADLATYNAVLQSTPPAERVVYVIRFSNGTDVYHISLETLADGSTRCYAGRLDTNDYVTNPTSGAVVGAAYNTDPGVAATCDLRPDGAFHFSAKISKFGGLSKTDKLYSVTAFSMIGPSEANQSLVNPMRTIDATPGIDTAS